jgi:hypothetical protein
VLKIKDEKELELELAVKESCRKSFLSNLYKAFWYPTVLPIRGTSVDKQAGCFNASLSFRRIPFILDARQLGISALLILIPVCVN